jgi:hypothetical protein
MNPSYHADGLIAAQQKSPHPRTVKLSDVSQLLSFVAAFDQHVLIVGWS